MISGKALHGKDTFANIAKNYLEKNGRKVLIAHYGDLVKYVCQKFFNWDGVKDEVGRSLLQRVGTEDIRKFYPNFWVDFMVEVLGVFHGEWDFVLIPDCRFENEISIFEQSGFVVRTFRVNRPNFDNGLTDEQKKHTSETALDDYIFDYYVDNDGGLDKYQEVVEGMLDILYDCNPWGI